jgi:hypothetical protein
MVQVYTDPNFPHHGSSATQDKGEAATGQEGRIMSREEHAQRMRELNLKRGLKKAPRRGWTVTDYPSSNNSEAHFAPASASAAGPHTIVSPQQPERHESIPEHAAVSHTSAGAPSSSSPCAAVPTTTEQQHQQQLPVRPKLPTPRRSYSVQDYEPVAPPNQPRPSSRFTILDLPAELHYSLCDYLDPIDSVCFGLAHSKLYAIHRRKYGTVPLSSRYSGPNDMEWAWRTHGPLARASTFDSSSSPSSDKTISASTAGGELVRMRVKGQVYCRKCGISRCELHRHLREWMGDGWEYCEIKSRFDRPAADHAKTYCYMSSPKNPHRCGRHGGKKTG